MKTKQREWIFVYIVGAYIISVVSNLLWGPNTTWGFISAFVGSLIIIAFGHKMYKVMHE